MQIRSAFLFSALVVLPVSARPVPPAQLFPPGSTVDVLHGIAVADPYRELENGSDLKVEGWSDAQNDRTRAYLDAIPGRAAVSAKLNRLVKAASPRYFGVQARGDRIFAIYIDPRVQQPTLVTLAASADLATRRMLVDPNAIDAKGGIAIDWYFASPDGSTVAVSLAKNGSEDGVLHVYDVATAREIEPLIPLVSYPTAGGSLAWAADSKGFWYTRYPGREATEAERHFNLQAYFHKLGTAVASDPLVLGAADGVPRTGEIFLDGSSGGAAVLASVQLGDGGQWQQFVLRAGQKPLRVAEYGDRIVAAAIAKDGTLFGVSRKDAPMGKLVRLDAPYNGGFAAAKLIVAARSDAAIIDAGQWTTPLSIAGDRIFVSRIAGGPSIVYVYDRNGMTFSRLPLPPVSGVGELVPLPNGDVLYSVSTYLEPPYFARLTRNGAVERTDMAMTSPTSYADAEVTRIFATSKDGTMVPLNIIAKRGVKLDGSNPVLLYGYGGYGINMVPSFSSGLRRLWLDGGGIYVVANLRGGGEYGDRWHSEGMLTKKQNVFDDFTAVAETLIRLAYTSQVKLAIMGGSNGGILMGAVLTQHPDLARAVVSEVGIYDSLRMETDPNGEFNITELGTVKKPEGFRALYAYSPYHNVRKGSRYPAVMLLTGANDGRVNPFHSRKFAAALQAAQVSDKPILLRTSKSSGHGIGSSLDETIFQITDGLMFLFDQLDMNVASAAR